MAIFKSFRSTFAPFLSRSIPNNLKLLVDSTTGAPAGIENWNANGADGIFVPIDLTAAQIAAPTALMLADLNATYRLNATPWTRYYSNGAELTPITSTTALSRLIAPASAARYINPQVVAPMATPPVISQSLSVPSGLSNQYLWSAAKGAALSFYGGQKTVSGFGSFSTLANTVGNPGTRSFGPARVEFQTDAPIVSFGVWDVGPVGVYRWIVDGQFVSKVEFSPTGATSGLRYITLDFTGLSGGPIRDIIFEWNVNFHSINVGPTYQCAPRGGQTIRCAVVGDSFAAGGGVASYYRSFVPILGDMLGIRDIIALGVPSTGYIADNSAAYLTFDGRLSDIVYVAPDILFITGGYNDNPYTAASVQAAVTTYLRDIRAQPTLSQIPIVVFGSFGGNHSASAGYIAADTGIAAAVAAAQLNDPLLYYVPCLADPIESWMTGTGDAAAPTGSGNSDIYINGVDHTHPNDAGHYYLAGRMADAVMRLALTGVTGNAVSTPPGITTGAAVQGPNGLFGTMISYAPLTVTAANPLTVLGKVSVRSLPA